MQAVTARELGGEDAMNELIPPIMTIAGDKKEPLALAHNQADFSSRSHWGSVFSTPLTPWREDRACDSS